MSRKLHICLLFMILLLAFLSPRPLQISAEEDYLIVRIVNAKYPPLVAFNKDDNSTSFQFDLKFQTINPSSSEITIPFVCTPLPFPYLRVNLRDKSLKVLLRFWVQWIDGDVTIPPGFRNQSYSLSFEVFDYVNRSLPLGTYEMWFDYTNCSSSPVPVITEKLYLDVTENSVAYYFDYNNETRIVSSLQQTNYTIFFSSTSFLLLLVLCKGWNRRKALKV